MDLHDHVLVSYNCGFVNQRADHCVKMLHFNAVAMTDEKVENGSVSEPSSEEFGE